MTSLFNPMDAGIYDNQSYLFAQAASTPLEGARVKASLDNVAFSMQNLSLSIHSSSEGLRSSLGGEMEKLSGALSETKGILEAKSVDSTIDASIKKLLKSTTKIEASCKTIGASISTLSDNLTGSMDEIKNFLHVQAVREQLRAKKIDQLESRLQQRENNSGGSEILRAMVEMERRLMNRMGELCSGAEVLEGRDESKGKSVNPTVATPATTPQQVVNSKQFKLRTPTTAADFPPPPLWDPIDQDIIRRVSTSDNDSSGRTGMTRTTSKKRKIEQSQSDVEPDTEDDIPNELVEPDTEDEFSEREEEKLAAQSDGGEFDPDHDPDPAALY